MMVWEKIGLYKAIQEKGGQVLSFEELQERLECR